MYAERARATINLAKNKGELYGKKDESQKTVTAKSWQHLGSRSGSTGSTAKVRTKEHFASRSKAHPPRLNPAAPSLI